MSSVVSCVEVPPEAGERLVADGDDSNDASAVEQPRPDLGTLDDGRDDAGTLDLGIRSNTDSGFGPNGRRHDAEPPFEPSDASTSPSPDALDDGREEDERD